MKPSNNILLHDSFEFKGGGERLASILCKELRCDLAYGHWSNESFDLSDLPGLCFDLNAYSKIPVWRTLKRLRAFYSNTKFLSEYETVIFSGQDTLCAVNNHSEGKNINYCNTPPRSVYDLREVHLSAMSPHQRTIHQLYNYLFKLLYEASVNKVDIIIANSNNIKKRIKHFLGRDSYVIYPPCETDSFKWIDQEDYYLSTARLSPYKRVDLIISAFLRMPDKKLIITSTGPEEYSLKQLAHGKRNIIFTGGVNDNKLRSLIGNAIATIYLPKEEDFGISPVESMAAGKPVIGVAEGGLLETVIDGETGLLISPNPTTEEVIDAIEKLDTKQAIAMRVACHTQANKFRREIFVEKMRAIIQ